MPFVSFSLQIHPVRANSSSLCRALFFANACEHYSWRSATIQSIASVRNEAEILSRLFIYPHFSRNLNLSRADLSSRESTQETMERSREHTPLPCEAVKGNTTFSDRLSAESDRTPVTHRVAEEEKKDITIQLDESLALGIDASPSPLPSPLFLSPFQPGSPFTPASSGLSPVTLPILRSPKSPSKSRNSRGRFSNAAGRTLEEGFVKAGTITRSIKKGEGTILEETEDGWTISDEGAFDLHMHNQSNLLVRKILRLQSLSLLRSTFHAVDSPNSSTPTIIFRIYLVVDSYRKRPLTADQLGDFVDVLELVISGNEGWEGVTGEERKLLERNVVEISMIWDDIASPIVPEGLDGYSIGLRTELMPHQVVSTSPRESVVRR